MLKYLEEDSIFHLQTKNTSYILKVLPSGHLGTLYYGELVDFDIDYKTLELKFDIEVGSQVIYDQKDKTYNMNLAFLEIPTFGNFKY